MSSKCCSIVAQCRYGLHKKIPPSRSPRGYQSHSGRYATVPRHQVQRTCQRSGYLIEKGANPSDCDSGSFHATDGRGGARRAIGARMKIRIKGRLRAIRSTRSSFSSKPAPTSMQPNDLGFTADALCGAGRRNPIVEFLGCQRREVRSEEQSRKDSSRSRDDSWSNRATTWRSMASRKPATAALIRKLMAK